MESDPKPRQQRRGRPPKTALDRFESSLFFSTLKFVSGKTWRELEDRYRRDTGLPPHAEGDLVEDFMDYAGGLREPSTGNVGPAPVDWALEHFPSVSSARDTILFRLLRKGERRSSYQDERPEDSLVELLQKVSDAVLNATTPYMRSNRRGGYPFVLLPEYRLLTDLDAVARVDHLDALAVLLVSVKKSYSPEAAAENAMLCRNWLRRWVSSHPELRRSHRHLWRTLHLALPQIGPLDGEEGIGSHMDAEQERQLVLRCCIDKR